MRFIIIDVKKKEVNEVDNPSAKIGSERNMFISLAFMRKTVHGFIKFATVLDNADTLYVSGKGLERSRTSKDKGFNLCGIHHRFIGNGIICGINENGDFAPAVSSIEDIRKMVSFH